MNVAIVGGSLCGLAAANVFIRLGAIVTLFEKFPSSFENRGSSLGFVDIPLWEHIRRATMVRRGIQASRRQGAYYYGDLWQFLYEGLPEDTVKFNRHISDLGNDVLHPSIDGITYDLVIIADGGWSSLRHYVNGDLQPEYAGHIIWRCKVKTEHLRSPDEIGAFTTGKYFAIALLVAANDGQDFMMGGVAISAPENEAIRPDDGASRHTDFAQDKSVLPAWFLPFIRQKFSHHARGDLVRWIEACASMGKITPQPLYEFAASQVVRGRLVVVGDAAHMASPGTAAGAHTGILDALGLLEAFSGVSDVSEIDAALKKYEVGGIHRARQLYLRSKQVTEPLKYEPGDELRR